jgi:drug/metabolite transporter (DMT)-like permease
VRGAADAPAGALGAAVFLGQLPSAVGFVLWGYAVARLPLSASTAALYLVPPVALAVSFVWLSEVPRPVALLGGAVSVLGVVLINRRTRHAAAPPHATSSATSGCRQTPVPRPRSIVMSEETKES